MIPPRLFSCNGRARFHEGPFAVAFASFFVLVALVASACGGSTSSTSEAEWGSAPVVPVGGGAPDPQGQQKEQAAREVQGKGERIFEGKLKPPLRLEAAVTTEGVWLSTSSGPIATGCLRLGDGVSVPTRGEVQDKAAIAECARRIKRSRADFADEKSVTVYGLANLKYETVIEVIDALRGNEEEELFPDVTVAVKR
jgi:hypothetical protein